MDTEGINSGSTRMDSAKILRRARSSRYARRPASSDAPPTVISRMISVFFTASLKFGLFSTLA